MFTTEQNTKCAKKYALIKSAEIEKNEFDDPSKTIQIELIVLWGDDYVLFSGLIDTNKSFSIGDCGNLNIPHLENTIVIDNQLINGLIPINDNMNYSEFSYDNIKIKARLSARPIKHKKHSFSNLPSFICAGLSAIAHATLLLSFAFFAPALGLTDGEDYQKDNLLLIRQYLNASAEREREAKPQDDVVNDTNQNDKEGGTGVRSAGEEGLMGNPLSRNKNKRFSIAGPAENKDIHIARENAIREARNFGLIGVLNSGAGSDSNLPTAVWGADYAVGNDPISARGNMWGQDIGDAFGNNGLGLSGIGESGGGKGEGIGLGNIGTIGHGAGLGDKQGFGNGHGILGGGHNTKSPKIRMGTTIVNGRLPPEIIQRTIRQQYGRMRLCYENGLKNNPNLQGRVSVRFVINRDGSVANVSNNGSDLPDGNVVGCVVRSYYGISFPEPKDGIVTVIYPIFFSPQ